MNERRFDAGEVTESEDKVTKARLKQIAGLIRNLPYREMTCMGHDLVAEYNVTKDSDFDMSEALLNWADKMLGVK